MKIQSINSKSNIQHNNKRPQKTTSTVMFAKSEVKMPVSKFLHTKLVTVKLQVQRIISDYKWDKFIKELNKDVEKMPKTEYRTRYPNHL